MDVAFDLYKNFIDGLVEQRDCIYARKIREQRLWPKTAADYLVRQNKVISSLSEEDREIIADMLQGARDSGVHDTLVYLNEEMTFNEMRIVVGSTELPFEPYGTEMFYDWIARCNGDIWPDEK